MSSTVPGPAGHGAPGPPSPGGVAPGGARLPAPGVVRALAGLGPLVTCAALTPVRGSVNVASAVLVLVLWVVGAAATGDRPAAIVAAASGGLWFDFFLTAPYLRLTIDDADDVEAAVLLVVIGLAVSEIALWGRRQQARAARRLGHLEGVVDVAATVVRGGVPLTEVVRLVGTQVVDLLDVDGFRFVEGPVRDPRVAVLEDDGGVSRSGRAVDVERTGLPSDEYVAVLVRRGDRTLGHFLLTATEHVSRPGREERRVAVALADQVALAFRQERGAVEGDTRRAGPGPDETR